MALFRTVFETFDFEKYRDFEFPFMGHWRSSKMVPLCLWF